MHYSKLIKPLLLGGGALTLAVTGAVITAKPDPIFLDTRSAKELKWDKPVSDEQWAIDVKAEQIDMRSDKVLQDMLANQTNKLAKNEKSFERFAQMEAQGIDPLKVLYIEYYNRFKEQYPTLSEVELSIEAQNGALSELKQRQWEIEKNKQSIERITKEIELRKDGFVILESDKNNPLFGSAIPPERVRHIID